MKKVAIAILFVCNYMLASGYETIDVLSLGKGPSIVIIPGLGGTNVWKSTIEVLSEKNRCHIISIKGLNGQKNQNDSDFSKVMDEIKQYINSEKLNKPILMGHSFGGFLSIQLISRNPELFKELILVDSYAFSLAMYNPAFTQEIGKQQSIAFKSQILALPDQNYSTFWLQNVKQLVSDTINEKIIYNNIILSERKNVTEAQAFMLSNDLRPLLKKITIPTVVLCSKSIYKTMGIDDATIKQRVNDQFKDLKDCHIFINEKSRHFIMLDDKEWFIENVKKFI
ncbi:MAG: alpha/beta hydrolase [Bacteroidales bacterium]|nr:MAG: alpha/beta hydrolase [Bacteroidales bacterium]